MRGALWLVVTMLGRLRSHLPFHHSLLFLELLLRLVRVPVMRGARCRHEWGPKQSVARREQRRGGIVRMPALLLPCRGPRHLVKTERARSKQRHPAHHRADAAMVLESPKTTIRDCPVDTRGSSSLASAAEGCHGNTIPPRKVMQMRTSARLNGA